MLNIFPIQFLAPIAYAILRLFVGSILIWLGASHVKNRKILAPVFTLSHLPFGLFFVWYMCVFEFLIGTLFILGLYTQIAALLGVALSLKFIIMHKRFAHPLIPSRMFYTLLFAASFTLLITGAGYFAFDLPI